MKIILALGFLLLSAYAFSGEDVELFDHEIAGCPENSSCFKEFGDLRKSWQALLKNNTKLIPRSAVDKKNVEYGASLNISAIQKFSKNNGFPFSFFWVQKYFERKELPEEKVMALWESACPKHQPAFEEKDIAKDFIFVRKGVAFVKEVKGDSIYLKGQEKDTSISLNKNFFFNTFYIWDSLKNTFQTFWGPAGEYPSHITSQFLEFVVAEDNWFFNIRVHPDQSWSLHERIIRNDLLHLGEEVECPKPLLEKWKAVEWRQWTLGELNCQKLLNENGEFSSYIFAGAPLCF